MIPTFSEHAAAEARSAAAHDVARRGLVWSLVLSVAVMGLVVALTSCSKPTKAPIVPAGAQQIHNVALMAKLSEVLPAVPFLPDAGYAPVNSAWLAGYYAEFREDLFRRDVTRWEGRFDCNKFATAYAVGAQMRFFRDMFHSWSPAQALAVGEVWYRPSQDTAHAINVAVTERGVIFIEPQTGREVVLTEVQRRSAFYCRF